MAQFPHTVKKGDPIDPRNWRRVVDWIKRTGLHGGRGISVTTGPSGDLITHNKDMFWGQIVTTGPLGTEADYTDERYWVKEQYVSNTTGDSTTATTFADKTNPLHVTATNIAEITGSTHNIASGEIIPVWIVKDAGDPKTVRYITRGAPIPPPPFVFCKGAITGPGTTVFKLNLDGTIAWSKQQSGININTGMAVDNNSDLYDTISVTATSFSKRAFADGTIQWSKSEGHFGRDAAFANSKIHWVTTANPFEPELRQIFRADTNGTIDYTFTAPDSRYSMSAVDVGSDGMIYIAGSDSSISLLGALQFDPTIADGSNPVWSVDFNAQGLGVVFISNSLIVFCSALPAAPDLIKTVWALDSSGSLQWSFNTGSDANNISADASGNTYIVGGRISSKSVWSLDSSGNPRWDYDTGAKTNDVSVGSDGNIYVGGNVAGGKNIWVLDSDGVLQDSYSIGNQFIGSIVVA